MKIEEADKNMKAVILEDELFNYYNPLNNDLFLIEGLPFAKKDNAYVRIPKSYKDKVTEAVYWLALQPSGGQIHFKTNASKISVKIKNSGNYEMCHMAATGQQSVDLYYRLKNQKKYHFFTVAKFNEPATEYQAVIFESDEDDEKEIIINLPLYEALDEILIGVNKEATISKAKPHKNKGKVIIYGTSITQGGCAARPGMSFTNILSRKLDVEFVNLGFSGSGLGENELAQLMTTIDDPLLYILDYEANGGATGDMKNNLEPFIDTLRKAYPYIPILVMSKLPFACDVLKKDSIDRRNFYYNFQKEMVEKKKASGDNNIYFLAGNTLFGKKDIDEFTVDGLHPTDLGFYKLATNLINPLKQILKNHYHK